MEEPRILREASEMEYLVWFRCNADFGPASGDVIHYMHKDFEKEMGMMVPKGWAEDNE
jgi:hypothetical protein